MKMVIYHHFHIPVQEYYRRGKQNLFPFFFECPHPGCLYRKKLRSHGYYQRNVLTFYDSFVIYIKRYYCPCCGRTISLLPSFLAKRFQYTSAFIFFVLFRKVINNLPPKQIVEKLKLLSGRFELSSQHIRFYRQRLFDNLPLITGFFSAKEIVFTQSDPAVLIRQIIRYYLPRFTEEYFSFNACHFLE
jgi:hypothetical protein